MERKANSTIDTPEKKDKFIKQQSEKNEVGLLVESGELSRLAVASSVKIDFDLHNPNGTQVIEIGNGGVFFDKVAGKNYWFVHTSGHNIELPGNNNKDSQLYISRPDINSEFTGFSMQFSSKDFGFTAITYGSNDIGCFAFEVNDLFNQNFAANDTMYLKDVLFVKPKITSKFNGVTYPSSGGIIATTKSKFNILEPIGNVDEYGTKQMILDNFVAEGGFSGTQIFETDSDLCVGILNGGPRTTFKFQGIDNVAFLPYSEIGRIGIEDLHQKAVESLKSRN